MILDENDYPINIGDKILYKGQFFGVVTNIKEVVYKSRHVTRIFFKALHAKTKTLSNSTFSTILNKKIIVLKYLLE